MAWAAMWLATSPAHADEVMRYMPWPFGTPEAEQKALPRSNMEPGADVARLKEFFFGIYLDLDKDGVPELIVSEQDGTNYCGSAGCDATIYKKIDGAWKHLGGFSTPPEKLRYSDELIGSYRALFASDHILIWNGKRYFPVCLPDHCRYELWQPPG